MINWLSLSEEGSSPRLKVFAILGDWESVVTRIAKGVYEHSKVTSSLICKAWVKVGSDVHPPHKILLNILNEVAGTQLGEDDLLDEGTDLQSDEQDNKYVELLARKFQQHLGGNRFLIVLDVDTIYWIDWERIKSALLNVDACSAILLPTKDSHRANDFSPDQILSIKKAPLEFYLSKACKLTENSRHWHAYQCRSRDHPVRPPLLDLVFGEISCDFFCHEDVPAPSVCKSSQDTRGNEKLYRCPRRVQRDEQKHCKASANVLLQ